ncbi:membrane protein, partial [Lacticaseibacillus rhamnosus]
MAEKHEADTSQAVDSAAVDQQQAAGGTSEASSATDAASKNAHVKQVRPASTVPEMIEQLTKKNDEYVFKLRRELKDGGMSATDEETLLKTMLPEMITAQRQ